MSSVPKPGGSMSDTMVIFRDGDDIRTYILGGEAAYDYECCHGLFIDGPYIREYVDEQLRLLHLSVMLGVIDWYDSPIPELAAFLALDEETRDSALEPGETPKVTAPWGRYRFEGLAVNCGNVRRVIRCGFTQ